MSKRKNDWVIYPDIPEHIIIDEYIKQNNMEEKDINVIDPIEKFNSSIITEEIEKEIAAEEVSEIKSEEPEVSELTEEEKREKYIQALKDSKKTFNTKKDFGVAYKAKRQKKNKQVKASKRANRKR